jgi:acetyl esterase/lipase
MQTLPTPMTLDDYLALRGPAPAAVLRYGAAPSQFAELFVPSGPGPHPLAVLVHGGCWTVRFGGIEQLRHLAGALLAHGVAVWNVEYRRVDEPGGGYPGTYLDINAALRLLTAQAPGHRLATSRLVAIGHSAGGQLVQWMAGRARIPATSPLFQQDFLPVREVISLGGLADLRREAATIAAGCGRQVAELAGMPGPGRPDVFADTSAGELLPNGSRTVLITGELDTISPPRLARDFARRARAAGDAAEALIVPGAGHYDEVAAVGPVWPVLLEAVRRALGLPPPAPNVVARQP